MKYEIILYQTSSDFDGRNGTFVNVLTDTMAEGITIAEGYLDEYYCVKVQSEDQEEIEIILEA